MVVSYLLRTDFAEVGAAEPYSEGIIDFLRAVEGADMAVLIREPPRQDGPTRRVSLRASIDELDVAAIARAAPPTPAELKQRLAGLRGEIELPIPAASAVKIGGERAYKLARRGIVVDMPTRRSRIDALDVISYTDGEV